MKIKQLRLLFLIIIIISCKNNKNVNDDQIVTSEQSEETVITEIEGYGPLDIPSSEFFWLVQPWKEGKLATIDGWRRFAEISFIGTNKIQIKPFSDFPGSQLDRKLITWPEAGLIAGRTGKMHHLEAVDDNKTKSHVPLLSWVHRVMSPVLLDSREGLVGYSYSSEWDNEDTNASLFVYSYKEDKTVYEIHEKEFSILLIMAMDNQYVLSREKFYNKENENVGYKTIFFNWRTNKIVENDLTKMLNKNRISLSIDPYRNINLDKRYLIGYSNVLNKDVKVSWNDEYSDVKIISLDYLLPKEKGMNDLVISFNGKWGTTTVSGYKGLNNERLYKRAFFHLDECYPNGISIPVITDDYEDYQWEYSAFVKHPVHGMCYAQEWHKKVNGKNRLYLRLYKMDGMLTEINRRLSEIREPLKTKKFSYISTFFKFIKNLFIVLYKNIVIIQFISP